MTEATTTLTRASPAALSWRLSQLTYSSAARVGAAPGAAGTKWAKPIASREWRHAVAGRLQRHVSRGPVAHDADGLPDPKRSYARLPDIYRRAA